MITSSRTGKLNIVCVVAVVIVVVTHVINMAEAKRDGDHRSRRPARSLAAEVINSTTISLKWSEQPNQNGAGESVTCPTRRYLIRLKQNDAGRVRTWKVEGERQSVSLHGLAPATDYYVRIVAVTCDGRSKPSRWVVVRTTAEETLFQVGDPGTLKETTVPGQPVGVSTVGHLDSADVQWQAPEESVLVRGYVIGYGEGVPDVNWQYLEAHRRNVTIRNLKKSTQYVISLRAFNNVGKGPVIYDLVYTRDTSESKSSVPTAPTSLQGRILSPTTAWLQWTDSSLGRSQTVTDNRYYTVHYQALPNGRNMSVTVKELHVVLYHLIPATRYEFKVQTMKDARPSSFSNIVVNRTFETAPSSAPRSVKVVRTGSLNETTTAAGSAAGAAVLVSWRIPRQANGNITEYLILYTWSEEVLQQPDKWQMIRVPSPSTETIIGNLNSSMTYYFRLQARNAHGYGPKSDVIRFDMRLQPQPGDSNNRTRIPAAPVSVIRADISHSVLNVSDEDEYDYTDQDRLDLDDSPDVSSSLLKSDDTTYREQSKTKRDPVSSSSSVNSGTGRGTAGDGRKNGAESSTSGNGRQRLPPPPLIDFRPRGNIPERQEPPRAGGTLRVKSGTRVESGQEPERNVSGADPENSTQVAVPFGSVVNFRVSAYITWPASIPRAPGRGCAGEGGAAPPTTPEIAGYRFRYWKLSDDNNLRSVNEKVTISLLTNVVLLDDLEMNARYRYQVKYLREEGEGGGGGGVGGGGIGEGEVKREGERWGGGAGREDSEGWSQTEEIDTRLTDLRSKK